MKTSLKHEKTTTEKISIKGFLSADGTEIIYDEDEKVIKLSDLFAPLTGGYVELSVSEKNVEDLLDTEA